MKFKTRIIVGFFLSTICMMVMSLIWHGVVLNDLNYIPKPHSLFYALWAILYTIVGLSLSIAIYLLKRGKRYIIKPWVFGSLVGFTLALTAFILGISFKGEGAQHLVVDFVWQMIEQGIGGFVIGFVYYMAERRDKIVNPQS